MILKPQLNLQITQIFTLYLHASHYRFKDGWVYSKRILLDYNLTSSLLLHHIKSLYRAIYYQWKQNPPDHRQSLHTREGHKISGFLFARTSLLSKRNKQTKKKKQQSRLSCLSQNLNFYQKLIIIMKHQVQQTHKLK